MNYYVAPSNRDDQLHIRLKPDVKEDLKILADLRGLTMSGLVHSLVVQTIRAEKSQFPQAFEQGKKLAPRSKKKMKLSTGSTLKQKAA